MRAATPPHERRLTSVRPILVLVGATAVGKSAIALAVARDFAGEIVNADALQLYRGLEIGTAKPTREERRAVPHHLLDVVDPGEVCSAADYAGRARATVAEIASRGKVAILVGGSGFYLQAALDGLGELPPTQPEVRSRLRARLESEGLATLAEELLRVDPETARRLAPNDRQRILRALEVLAVSGETMSAWQRRAPLGRDALPAWRIGLTLPRALLYHRIEKRVHEMLEAGWVEEVRSLLSAGVPPEAPAFQAIGYRQLAAYVTGRSSLDQAVAETIGATRRFAKRQETWFRRDERIRWHDARDVEAVDGEVRRWLAAMGAGETA